MSAAKTAFTGYSIHAVPFADIQAFRTPLYSKWCTLRKAEPDTTPDWPTFRDSQKDVAPRVSTEFRRYASISIEPAGSGIKRNAMRKAAI